jgi:serine/threonine-protein kinase
MELAPGVVIAGKYRLERPLARGGMGALWQAQHAQLKVPLAIKFMEPAYAASAVGRSRFEREATAAAQLRHPNVVHVQDYGVEGDFPYIVMELLIGEDLSKRLKRFRRLPLPAINAILAQAAKALRRAHEGGFIHRDLKPSNIFLARGDEDEEIVKILDFGIAKQLTMPLANDGENTRTGELIGSPSYMSPEQIRGAKDIDSRADLWSLAVILFRCLTGKLPFDGDTTPDIIANILTAPMPLATSFAVDLPPGINAFFERALARDRDARFQSVRELTDAFASVTRAPMASMPHIEAPPPPVDPTFTRTPPPASFTSTATPPSYAPHASQALLGGAHGAYPPPLTPGSIPPPRFPPLLEPTYSPTPGSTRQASDPGLDLRETARRDRPPMLGLGGESTTLAPGGTLTVSPSITGGDPFRTSRKPVGWWIIGTGVIVGITVGLALVVGRSDKTLEAAGQTSESATAAPGSVAPLPAPEVVAPLPVVAPSASAAPSSSANAAQPSASASGSKKVKGPGAGTTRPPPPPPTSKRKDWGI